MDCHRDCRCWNQRRVDVTFVAPQLAVGGMVHPDEILALQNLGITHILNVNWPDRPEYPEVVAAFSHCDLPIRDDSKIKPASWFQAGIEFAATMGLSDKLLVHCGHGVNRSPAMAYAILRSWGIEDAESVLRSARPQTGTGSTGGAFTVYRQCVDAMFANTVIA